MRAVVPAAARPPQPATARRWPWLLAGAAAGLLAATSLAWLCFGPRLLGALGLATVPRSSRSKMRKRRRAGCGAALDAELDSGQWAAALVTADRAHAAGDRAAAPTRRMRSCCTTSPGRSPPGCRRGSAAATNRADCAASAAPSRRPSPRIHSPPRGTCWPAASRSARSPPLQNLPQPRPRAARRLHLLAAHAAAGSSADLAALPQQLELLDDPLARLLAVRRLPFPDRAPAFLDLAARLPITGPEHWLARRCAGGGDDEAAQQAWWRGAGELAVLLDAALRVLPADPAQVLTPLPASTHTRLRRRVGATDPAASPASPLLVVLLDALQPTTAAPDLEPARALPAPWHVAAAAAFVELARATPDRREALLLLATALGARPDFAQAPWQDVPTEGRARLEAEARRGR